MDALCSTIVHSTFFRSPADQQWPLTRLDKFMNRGWNENLPPLRHIRSCVSNGSDTNLVVDARPSIEIIKSKWDDAFASYSLDMQVQEKYAEAIEALKEDARKLVSKTGSTRIEKLVLIDTLERLGVAYHFDQEIEEQLEQIFQQQQQEEDEDDLFITSLQFRLLRQHRYHASSDVFDKFKCQDNKFKEALESDVKGLLSLYEAAHLRIHGEDILDEAVDFTAHHLKRMLQNLECPLQDQVKRALEQPLHRGSPRIESRHYISFYEKYDSRNETLLKLAKLDFNYLQNMYKNELCQLSRWWDELKPQLSYARSRVIENHLYGTTFQFKPQYSYVRVAIAKICSLISVLDDTYDNYATLEEAEIFTQTLRRGIIEEINRLPDYMKIIYRLILRVYDDYEREAAQGGKEFAVHYAKQTVKEVCEAYNKELKWFTRSVAMPSFEEYLGTMMISSCLYAICAWTIPGISVSKETSVDWLQSEPKIVEAAALVCRYLDDIGSYHRESKNGEVLTGVDIYMTQHGSMSMQETKGKFMELAEDAWKDFNTQWMLDNSSSVHPKEVLELALGYARGAEMFCRSCEDGYTKPEIVAHHISALFLHPITI